MSPIVSSSQGGRRHMELSVCSNIVFDSELPKQTHKTTENEKHKLYKSFDNSEHRFHQNAPIFGKPNVIINP